MRGDLVPFDKKVVREGGLQRTPRHVPQIGSLGGAVCAALTVCLLNGSQSSLTWILETGGRGNCSQVRGSVSLRQKRTLSSLSAVSPVSGNRCCLLVYVVHRGACAVP